MMQIVQWLNANYLELGIIVATLLSAAEMIVRLTPTKADDGALERVGKVLRQVLDFLKIPNLKKK